MADITARQSEDSFVWYSARHTRTDGITARQSEALEAIRELVDANAYPPTHAELGQRLGISGSGARGLLLSLAAAGRVRVEPGRARAITILESAAA